MDKAVLYFLWFF